MYTTGTIQAQDLAKANLPAILRNGHPMLVVKVAPHSADTVEVTLAGGKRIYMGRYSPVEVVVRYTGEEG